MGWPQPSAGERPRLCCLRQVRRESRDRRGLLGRRSPLFKRHPPPPHHAKHNRIRSFLSRIPETNAAPRQQHLDGTSQQHKDTQDRDTQHARERATRNTPETKTEER